MDELAHDLEGLAHARLAYRDESFHELLDRTFNHGKLEPAVATRLVPGLIPIALGPHGTQAAVLLLHLVAAAQRGAHRDVLATAAPLEQVTLAGLASAIRDVLVLARKLVSGAPAPDDESIDALCDAATASEKPAPPTPADVVEWCRGGVVGDYAADSVVPLLAEVALGEGAAGVSISQLEQLARRAVQLDRKQPAGVILGQAHRTIFHAVLAWRIERTDLLAGFPAHREEERALAKWAIATERVPAVATRLCALLDCTNADEVRERERAKQLGAIVFPPGDVL